MSLRSLIVVAAAFASAIASSSAEAIFLGDLQEDAAYDLNIDNGSIASGKTGITIYYLSAKGNKIKAMESITAGPGERITHSTRVPKKSRRVMIDVQPPSNSTVNVEVVQGVQSFPQACAGDTHLMWDVVSEP